MGKINSFMLKIKMKFQKKIYTHLSKNSENNDDKCKFSKLVRAKNFNHRMSFSKPYSNRNPQKQNSIRDMAFEKIYFFNFRVFGCNAYAIDYHAKKKIDSTIVGRDLGQICSEKPWRIFDDKKISVRKNVIFNESNITYKKFKKY